MQDSIYHTIDSVNHTRVDSAFLSDSIHRADSLSLIDSVKMDAPVFSGFEGILHPSSPSSESWVFIILVLLFLLLVIGIIRSAGEFFQNIKIFSQKKEPVNIIQTETVNFAQFQIIITIFTISVFTLTVYEVFFISSSGFHLKTFGLLSGITAGYYLLKRILINMIGYTFFKKKITNIYNKMYFNLMNVLAVVLFPVLVLFTYQPGSWHQPLLISMAGLTGIFYIFLIVKLFQVFYSRILDLFYIFLYLCTLEIIPLLLLFWAYNLAV